MEKNKNSMLKLLASIFAVIFILTWLLPSAYYSGDQLVDIGKGAGNGVGLIDAVSSFFYTATIPGIIDNILLIFVIGIVYGILNKVPAYHGMLNCVAKSASGLEKYFLIGMSFLVVFIINITGLSYALLILVPMFIQIATKLGYSKENSAIAVLGSISAGLMGSVLGYAFYTPMVEALGKQDTLMTFRLITSVLAFIILIVSLIKMPREEVEITTEEEKEYIKWPLYVFGIIMIVVTILGFIPWDKVLGTDSFVKLINEKAVKDGNPRFWAKLLANNLIPFGYWNVQSLMKMALTTVILIGAFSKLKFDDLIDAAFEGIQKAIKPVIAVVFATSILALSLLVPILFPILIQVLKLGTNKIAYLFTMPIFTLISELFIPEAILTSRFVAPAITVNITNADAVSAFPLVWQMFTAIGFILLPTSLILAPVLTYVDLPYKEYIKKAWKLIVANVVLALVITGTVLKWVNKLSYDAAANVKTIKIALLITVIIVVIAKIVLFVLNKKRLSAAEEVLEEDDEDEEIEEKPAKKTAKTSSSKAAKKTETKDSKSKTTKKTTTKKPAKKTTAKKTTTKKKTTK